VQSAFSLSLISQRFYSKISGFCIPTHHKDELYVPYAATSPPKLTKADETPAFFSMRIDLSTAYSFTKPPKSIFVKLFEKTISFPLILRCEEEAKGEQFVKIM
jgi:hypothetical protein